MNVKDIKKQLTKDWGKRCPDYDAGCFVCNIWRAYDVIESSYDVHRSVHKVKWVKPTAKETE